MENHDNLKENLEHYIENKVDLVKIKVADKAGTAISGAILGLTLARLLLFILLFLSFSAAYAISQATGKNYLGFLLVAGFYCLLAVLIYVLREKLITMPIINALLKKLKYKEHKH